MSYYEHLASFNPGMSLFTSVPKGYQVGIIGGTPDVPIHLHFEIRDGVQTNPINIRTTEDSRGHSYIRTKIYRRIGLFPWYPNEDMNSGFVPRSTSHPVGVCLRNRVLVMRWLAPNEFDHNEDGAGNADRFQGYDWELSMVNSTVPQGPNPKPGSATSSGITFNNLADGNYWFHLRAYSSFYGWAPETSVSHIGPFKINSNCPHSPSESDWLADPD